MNPPRDFTLLIKFGSDDAVPSFSFYGVPCVPNIHERVVCIIYTKDEDGLRYTRYLAGCVTSRDWFFERGPSVGVEPAERVSVSLLVEPDKEPLHKKGQQ